MRSLHCLELIITHAIRFNLLVDSKWTHFCFWGTNYANWRFFPKRVDVFIHLPTKNVLFAFQNAASRTFSWNIEGIFNGCGLKGGQYWMYTYLLLEMYLYKSWGLSLNILTNYVIPSYVWDVEDMHCGNNYDWLHANDILSLIRTFVERIKC